MFPLRDPCGVDLQQLNQGCGECIIYVYFFIKTFSPGSVSRVMLRE